MAKLDLYNLEATVVGSIDLADTVFGITPNQQAMYDAVLLAQASLRQGTHKTKTRTEVSGGGKKPFRQKGTGRAREGSTRATQFRGGGIALGPTPRKYGFKLNKKIKQLALKSALSQQVADGKVTVVENLKFEAIKTKEFVRVMNNFKFDRKTLFVFDCEEDCDNACLSMANIPTAGWLTVEELNVYDILNAYNVVFTQAAANKAKEVFE